MKRSLLLLFMVLAFALAKAQDSVEVETVEPSDTYVEDVPVEEDTYVEGSEEGAPYEEYSAHELVPAEDLNSTREYESEEVQVNKFDDKEWKKIVGSTNYNEKPPKEQKNKSGAPPISIAPWGGAVLRIIAYVVIAGVVGLLLYLIFKNVTFDLKLKKTQTHEHLNAPVENIEEIDIHALLQQAIAEGNFRLAVRLYYLGLLKKLNEMGMIAWKKDKTNRDYLMELFSKDYYFDDIKKLTLSYEQVWYGEHTLTSESFRNITTGFETVHQKINTPREQ